MLFANEKANGPGSLRSTPTELQVQKTVFMSRHKSGLPTGYAFSMHKRGPYSQKLSKSLQKMSQLKIVETTPILTEESPIILVALAKKTKEFMHDRLEPWLRKLDIQYKISSAATYLRTPYYKAEKEATDAYLSHLDSERDLVYLDRVYQERIEGKSGSVSTWNLDLTMTPLTLTLGRTTFTPGKDIGDAIQRALVEARRNTPTSPRLRSMYESKAGRRYSLKFLEKTWLGHCYIYSPIPDVLELWHTGDEALKAELKNSMIKSIGKISPRGSYHKRLDMSESEFDCQFETPEFPSTAPLLLDDRRLMLPPESLKNMVVEVLWKPCSLAEPPRMEMYPLAITKVWC